jgi:two-component system cell cycle sensor histidine kinase/response regulator CckA
MAVADGTVQADAAERSGLERVVPLRRRWSLRVYLIGLVVVFSASAGTGVLYLRGAAAHDARQGGLRDARFGATLAAQDIASALGLARTTVASLAANPSLSTVFSAPAGCKLAFGGPGAFASGHLDIIGLDGSVACSSLQQHASGYAGAPWVRAVLTGPIMTGPVLDVRTGKQVVVVGVPIADKGAVVAFLDLEALGPGLAASVGGPRNLEFVVTSADERIALARSIDPGRWVGADVGGTPFGRTANQVDHVDLDGTSRLYGQATVESVGWRVFAGASRASALAQASRLSRRDLLITLGGLLLFLAATTVVVRCITRPITRLSAAVRAATTRHGLGSIEVAGPAEVAALAEDVNTLIAAAERELVGASRVAAIVESSADAIIGKTLDGTITSWNSGAERMYGYPAEEVVGHNVSTLVPAGGIDELRELMARAARGERVQPYETQRLRKDGSLVEVSVAISPIRGGSGAVVGASATAHDITERKQAEAERESLRERLNQSQRLESLGQLAGGIAHDFNNLLGVILNYASFVAEQTQASPEGVRADVAQIKAAAERGAGLTRQLMLVARRETLQAADLDLNAIVADMHSLLSRSIGEHIELVGRRAASLQPVRADRGQMEQILLNLAVNARDAMPAGGTLTIETRQTDLDEDYCRLHPEVRPGAFVELSVSDTGVGIPPEVADRIFEPFFTTKPRGEGTGLGLATLYGIVKAAEGSVSVYSEQGIGTTFRIFLPAVGAPQGVIDRGPGPVVPRRGDETILVVDDEPALLEVTARMLRRNGYTVIEADAWDQAVSLGTEHDFQLLLTDSVMPQVPGRDLAELLRKIRPGIALLFMSGYTEGVLGPRHLPDEGAAFIEKPFNERALLEKVRAVLDGGSPRQSTSSQH